MVTPSPGGPAERAGIAPHDALVAINGRPLAGLTLYDAGEMLQGPEGSEVRHGAPAAARPPRRAASAPRGRAGCEAPLRRVGRRAARRARQALGVAAGGRRRALPA